jgi:glycosyltransferase involved in cell wall biosynthesis
MPRVLHLIDHNGLGGAQRVVAGILQRRPSDLVFPLRLKPNSIFPYPSDYPLRNTQFAILTTWISQVLNMLILNRWLKKHPIDLIHCHLTAAWLAGLWLHMANKGNRKIRLLFHEHNPYILNSTIYPYLVRVAARKGRIIVVSQFFAEITSLKGISKERILLLPNFVEAKFFSPVNQVHPIDLDPEWVKDQVIIGFAGRLVESKGWRDLIEVAEMMRSEPVRFLVAGSGRDEQKLRQVIREHGLGNKIRLAGYISDMRQFYRSIDTLIFPSAFEIFGLVPLEAQASGVPVIAYNIPGLNESISEENAILVPPDNRQALATQIKQLIKDHNLRNALVSSGYVNARRFSIETYLTRLEEIYQTTCQEHGS